MKKKIKINLPVKFSYDAPITLTFVFLCLILFAVNKVVLKNDLNVFFLASPTKNPGDLPFKINSFYSYAKMFLYAFGGVSWTSTLCNLLFILLLGPSIEEKYGSIIIGLMIFVSAVFSGVLNACFCTISLQGPGSVVFMLIFLNAFISFSKKKIPLSFLVVFVFYILYMVFEFKGLKSVINPEKDIGNLEVTLKVIICVAGGLCGSLFAFLTSPKSRAARKADKPGSGLKARAEVLAQYDDENSPRFKNKKSSVSDEDSEVIGTIKF